MEFQQARVRRAKYEPHPHPSDPISAVIRGSAAVRCELLPPAIVLLPASIVGEELLDRAEVPVGAEWDAFYLDGVEELGIPDVARAGSPIPGSKSRGPPKRSASGGRTCTPSSRVAAEMAVLRVILFLLDNPATDGVKSRSGQGFGIALGD